MLSRNNSTQSNLSAAAAATALRRASTQSQSQQDITLQHRLSNSPGIGISPSRPGLHRRISSSMSERSFRAQAPEDHARERRGRPASLMDITPEGEVKKPKRRGSFTLSMSLRSNSLQKKAKQVALGAIPPLPEQQQQQQQLQKFVAPQLIPQNRNAIPQPDKQLHKLKASMRGDRGGRERERSMSPTHSAMKLPSHPGIGSAASSIRSLQTDLSSIAEDQALGYPHANPKLSAHFFPMKSAMKGGSGPPSIISEAVSEESRSSIGPHDRKGKVRVSFSDEQENQVNLEAGTAAAAGVGPGAIQAATTGATAKGTKDGFLKPRNAVVLRRLAPASPPMSPEVSPHIPTVVPLLPPSLMPTPPTTQPEPIVEELTVPEAKEVAPNEPTSAITTPLNTASNNVNNTPQVTIHVSPTPSSPPKTRLPGSFPDPTPEQTPPSTAESASDAHEMTDTLSPHPRGKQQKSIEAVSNLELQRGLSLGSMALVLGRSGVSSPEAEKMVRRISNGSQGSGMSDSSDAMDNLPEQKQAKRRIAKQWGPRINGPKERQAQINRPKEKTPRVNQSSIIGPAAIVTGATTVAVIPAINKLTKTVRPSSVSKLPGTIVPAKAPMKFSLRENGATTRTTLRPSSAPPRSLTGREPTSPIAARYVNPDRKPMRKSLRANEQTSTVSADMARGLMSLPQIERVPSDSSFKRLTPREQSGNRLTLRSPPAPEPLRTLRRGSDESSEIRLGAGGRRRSSSIFGIFKRNESVSSPVPAERVTAGSRFLDSSDDDDDFVLPVRGIGRTYEDAESLPTPTPILRKRTSFSQIFRSGRKGSDIAPVVPRTDTAATDDSVMMGDGRHRRSKSGSILRKKTSKEKQFQGLRKLFRIKG
jgi:hypothetical protein